LPNLIDTILNILYNYKSIELYEIIQQKEAKLALFKRKMVKNAFKLNRFQEELIKKENFSYKKALLIFEAMFKEAITLGAINSGNILEGLEIDIKIARAINGLT